MKPNNPNFWSRLDGQLVLRNLEREEAVYRNNIFPAWSLNQIDEAIVIYYEVYDCHSADFIDDSIYQLKGCYLKPGDHVLDLGANVGIFTRWASDAGAKKIYSFEPVQENFQLLALNRPENCEAHRLAITDEDMQNIQIAYKEDCPGGSSFVKHDDGVLQTAMGMTLDTLLEKGIIEKIDFMKMDIEGAEVHAFNGISDDNLNNIRCIAMEIHVAAIGKEEADKIYNRLSGLGFNHYTIFNPDQNNIAYFWKESN